MIKLRERSLQLAHRFWLPSVVVGLLSSALQVLVLRLWDLLVHPLGVAGIRGDDASDPARIEHGEGRLSREMRRALVASSGLISLQSTPCPFLRFPQLLYLRFLNLRPPRHFMKSQVQFLRLGRLLQLNWTLFREA